uniref:P-selectin glycoprotein ligand 1 n=1 Tax=Mus musculus TaxID=10090 RepID=SELPL_MOUSE|nr:RecName: Full=P-selectin glycoprotein ligand 1; Short=PSGL-1; AltName: Full=Selectin P ligand; AltName: CD_antigen=CD162; Flags: Precursor [Mus musculus]
MSPSFLVLLTILGPGNSLQLQDPWGHETKEAPGPVHLRERRQVVGDDDFEDPDYTYNTDPPELLKNVTNTVAAHPELPTTVVMLERDSTSAGTSERATEKIATTDPTAPGTGGTAVGMLSTDSATQWSLTSVETVQPASTEVETSQPAPMEAETSQPAPMEAETSQPAPMEAETSQPAPMEADTSQPAPMEAETSQPAPNEAETSKPAPTEAETSKPAPTEAETTQLPRIQAVKTLFTTSAATEVPSTEPTTMETASTESNESTIFLGPSVTHLPDSGLKKGLIVTPGNSPAPTLPGSSDLIPVKQCLLIILILASLATIFLVCTVVLAVRLSRKTHMYPVRNYSPTEMICISSLLPEGGDGAPVTANGGLPKVQDLKTEPSGDRDGDDLTLHSFLP